MKSNIKEGSFGRKSSKFFLMSSKEKYSTILNNIKILIY